ncbi:iridoid oxidase [Ricinus communis]|uniref:Cytochrome P450, putative n=1 Tax=Ricinus communis TaxID=3988 RepID=B9SRN4_RICCO|nr:iridoid oxidase [Ricinus communis]EEF33756.1 cytochrome P450, putative [Ricinus communis]|eukprot:XP_002528653.1 cytochrome P450 76A1 [Ricinus communis]
MALSYSNYSLAWFTLLFSVTIVVLLKKRRPRHDAKQRPPGPPAWPIIGNIFDLGANPHQNLYKLGFKYGPVLWLRLGYINTMVIQSAKAAEELFKHHDISFCDRKVPQSFTARNYCKAALALGRYDSHWRFHRRFVTLELMTNKRINETAVLRQKCIDKMIRYIDEDASAARARGESGELVISHYVFVMSFNLIGNLALSRDLLNSHSEEGTEFFDAMDKAMEWGGKPNLADFLPFLQGLDPQRVKKNMEQYLGRTIDIVERFVKERIEEKKLMKERDTSDFLDALLEFKGDAIEEPDAISTHSMLIILLEIFFGGTETTSGTLEWVMAELFRSPESMRRVKEELNQVIGPHRKVVESDIDQLPYLQAVIKEGMRLHPVLPLLVPRNTMEDTTFMEYFIAKDTQVFVNAWAIGRDPDAWEDPLSFKPERFLGSNIDYKGQNFELLPFGSGRRICVGIPLAHRVLHLALASLLHCFDWELGSNSTPESIDMNERLGITVRKLVPMKAIPKKKILQD